MTAPTPRDTGPALDPRAVDLCVMASLDRENLETSLDAARAQVLAAREDLATALEAKAVAHETVEGWISDTDYAYIAGLRDAAQIVRNRP